MNNIKYMKQCKEGKYEERFNKKTIRKMPIVNIHKINLTVFIFLNGCFGGLPFQLKCWLYSLVMTRRSIFRHPALASKPTSL